MRGRKSSGVCLKENKTAVHHHQHLLPKATAATEEKCHEI